MWAHLGAMLAHLGAMLAHLGAMLAQLGAMLAHLGAMLAHLGGYVGPSWGYVGPSWGLCCPMLTDLEPQDPKNRKNMLNVTGPKNTVNYRGFCRHAHPTGGRRQGAQPLSPTERRELPYGKDTARVPLAGFKRLRATAGQGPNYVGQLLACFFLFFLLLLLLRWLWLWLWALLWLLVVGG